MYRGGGRICDLQIFEATYRADVDSLVDISKLTLTYAASQLNAIPLNLIVTCWIHNIYKDMNTQTHTYGDRDKDTQRRPLDYKPHTSEPTHGSLFSQAFHLPSLSEHITACRV